MAAGAMVAGVAKKAARKKLLQKLYKEASDRAKGEQSENVSLIGIFFAIFLPVVLIISIIVNLIPITFGFLGFASANSFNAVFAQQVVSDLTTEDIAEYFGSSVPSLAKDESGEYEDPRAYIHEGISKQWYCAITGEDHLIWMDDTSQAAAVTQGQTADIAIGGLANSQFVSPTASTQNTANTVVTGGKMLFNLVKANDIGWSSADGLRDIFNDYKSYLENNTYKTTDDTVYNVTIENDFMSIFNMNLFSTWDRDNMETYQGIARTNYDLKSFWESQRYAEALKELAQKHLSVNELKEIENYKKTGNNDRLRDICKTLEKGIVNLDTNKVFGKGAFTTTTPSEENNTFKTTFMEISTGARVKYVDVTLSITDYVIPFYFYQYKNDCAKDVEYKNVTDENTMNLAVSMLKNMQENRFDEKDGENNGITTTSGLSAIMRVLSGFSGGLVTYRGVEGVGSEDNMINPDFDLEGFDDWYKQNDGYTRGAYEFVNVKYASSFGTTMGSSIQDMIYMTLRNQTECTHTTACGVMGNINNESGWNPASDDNPPNGPFGLCQWLNGGGSTRRSQLENMAIINGKQPTDASAQADFLALDLNTGHKQDVDICNAQYPFADDATVYMMCKYYAAPSWPIERTMVAYTGRGKSISTHSFNFTGAQNGAGSQDFKTEERIAEGIKFDQIYQAFAFVPNGQVYIMSAGGIQGTAAEYCVAQIGKEYDQGRREQEGVYDCSSLIARAYEAAGFGDFRSGGYSGTTITEWNYCEANGCLIPYDDNYVPQVGDIWFFGDSYGANNCTHVGMYVGPHGDFDFVHAKGKAYGVVTESIANYNRKPQAVGRLNV